jgi:outer membrane scaffolding protein for murein synthesis (MipA/OmpV family)
MTSGSFLEMAGFRLGPAGTYVAPRNAANFTELRGLGDVNAALELGGFLEYFPVDWLRGRVEVLQGFAGHHGVVRHIPFVQCAREVALLNSPAMRRSSRETAASAPRRCATPSFRASAADGYRSW